MKIRLKNINLKFNNKTKSLIPILLYKANMLYILYNILWFILKTIEFSYWSHSNN